MQIEKMITKLNFVFFRIGAFSTFCLIILTLTSVLSRYLFQMSYVWLDELLWHLFGLSFLLGSAYTLSEDGHVRVDILYHKYSKKTKAWVDIAGVLFFMIPLCGLIIWYGFTYTLASFNVSEVSPNPNGIPYRWLIKSSIPIGITLLVLQGISHLIRQVFIVTEKDSPKTSEKELR